MKPFLEITHFYNCQNIICTTHGKWKHMNNKHEPKRLPKECIYQSPNMATLSFGFGKMNHTLTKGRKIALSAADQNTNSAVPCWMQMALIPTVIISILMVYFHALLTLDDSIAIKLAAHVPSECGAGHPANVIQFFIFTVICLYDRRVWACVGYTSFFSPLWGLKNGGYKLSPVPWYSAEGPPVR